MRWLEGIIGSMDMSQLEQTPGDGEGQGGLACCSPWGHRKSDVTERLSKTPAVPRVDISGHQGFLFSFIKREKVFPSIILETTVLLLAFFLMSDKKLEFQGILLLSLDISMRKQLSCVRLFATPWTIAQWATPSIQARILEWVAISFSRESS